MNAPDATGGHEAEARQLRGAEGAGDGGGTELVGGDRPAEVARAHLYSGLLSQAADLVFSYADAESAVGDRDRGRDRAGFPDRFLAAEGRVDVVGRREAVGDDRRFQEDDGGAFVDRFFDVGAEPEGARFVARAAVARAQGRAPRFDTAAAPTRTARPAASSGVAPSR